MSRIDQCFGALRAEGRKALVPYISAGDPNAELTLELMHGLVNAGANLIELGVPFSDPMADGPVVQKAAERALAAGMTLEGVLSIVAQFRASNAAVPVVLMGYLNPIERMGYAAFAKAASSAGVDGVLIVDLPPEEGAPFLAALGEEGLAPIFLLSPTTSTARVQRICADARGYVYYVSLKGVTGAAHLDTDTIARPVEEIRALTDLPVGVGFGISDPQSAKAVASVADAVVVGSAIVRRIEEHSGDPPRMVAEVCELVSAMRSEMDTIE